MKIKGKAIEPPKPFEVVIPRTEGDIVLKVQAVLDYAPFNKACPEPEPPTTAKPGQAPKKNWDDPKFKQTWSDWFDKRQGWMAVKSLSATEGLEFDSISVDDPDSCNLKKLNDELRAAGFLEPEIRYIGKKITQANAMDEKHIEEARERFLRQRDAEQSASS